MLKKTTACLFALALFVAIGTAYAQEDVSSQFRASAPGASVTHLSGGTGMDLRNVADLTQEELKAALEKGTCSGPTDSKNLDRCFVFEGPDCTGAGFFIPCGFFANAKENGFRFWGSFVPGCTRTFFSTCDNLMGPPDINDQTGKECQLFLVLPPAEGKVCITPLPESEIEIKSVACITP